MYKILTRLHTLKPGNFHYHMVTDANGELVEFQAETKEEVEMEAIKILRHVGCMDLRVIEEHPYYVDIQYGTDEDFDYDNEEARALALVEYIGWGDLRISDNKPFSVDMIWGEREKDETRYTLSITGPESCVFEPNYIDNIIPGTSKVVGVTFTEPVKSFHFIINGERSECVPGWIDYTYISDQQCVLTFNAIDQNYEIQIEVDTE